MTSIEWFEQRMKDMIEHGADFGEDYPALLVHLKKTKELHEQEIINAYKEGREDEYLDYYPDKHAKEYYNKTFKK